jgi:succinate dehydrogenase/fumarate reductase flavoprotein subunit
MAVPNTQTVECDILIIGGGMSGCGAAFEAKYWGRDLRVVMVEKAAIERSGATGEGLRSQFGFGGGGMHGYRSLEGTFLGGCIFSGRVAGRAAARALA